ncbi:hypothetical protein L596_022850 [Steinernema carpocapsae]|uniref:Uncharacterized protein n=1 Tax=Steinernema carpocapsae TaxID=34508 RepID=A0A4U5MMY4_STECR|nr:hypothetical protein L596_022850 [Steinernema carpocapsae]
MLEQHISSTLIIPRVQDYKAHEVEKEWKKIKMSLKEAHLHLQAQLFHCFEEPIIGRLIRFSYVWTMTTILLLFLTKLDI